MGSLKDIPFIDTLMPLFLSLAAWFGLNLFFIGPNIIAPRMSANIWHPACERQVAAAQAAFQQQQQSQRNAYIAQERAQREQAMRMANPLLQLFGPEAAKGIEALNKTVTAFSEIELAAKVKQRFADQPQSLGIRMNYCGCVISEALSKRTDLALYSASLRFWEPDSIGKLNKFQSGLIASNQCGLSQ